MSSSILLEDGGQLLAEDETSVRLEAVNRACIEWEETAPGVFTFSGELRL